jgi:IclR family pca regulon transcriptional regulator
MDSRDIWQERLVSFGDRKLSQSLEIGLVILQMFSPGRPLMGIGEIANELGMSRPNTQRYVTTLRALGFLEQGAKRKYRLTPRARDVGMSMLHVTGLPSVSLPFLHALRDRVGHTVSLAILDRDAILYAARVYAHGRGQYEADEGRCIGSRVPASCTATGKALVAGLSKEDERAWVDETVLGACGPNAIVRKTEFRVELERVREHGYAVNNRELAPSMVAIAAPVKQGDEISVAIGVAASANVMRPSTLVERCRDALLATASELAERLDYNPRTRWRTT